jgi:FtsP/CotA-like multicopper oxidase with cupredoxin domain
MIGPLLEDPQREGVADDAFLSLVTMDEGSPVDPLIEQTFLCLAHSGVYGASRMPRLPAFVQSLPIPPDLRPRERRESVGTTPVALFELHERPFPHRFHPDLPPSPLWGYEGMFPGPTLRVRRGEPSLVRVRNELPPDGGGGVGQPRTAFRVGLSDSAGTPEDHFGPGESRDYPLAALPATSPGRAAPGTGRYRDGRLGFGAQNVYKGLAGFLISTDPVDSGDENDPNPGALRLPGGPCDVPLLLADRRFGVMLDHPLAWNPFSMTGCPDDYVTVNGAVQPYFKVARRKYRFRIWNAGPSRTYELSLSNRSPLILLAVDGYLLEAPVERADLRLSADQLRDVVIDFSRVPLGTEVYLEDQAIPGAVRANSLPGVPRPPLKILKFLVDRDAPDPSRVPSKLDPGTPETVPLDLPTRTFAFADGRGVWTLNGKSFDLDRADAVGKPGAREVWILKNESKDQSLALRLTAEGRLASAPASPPWESGPRSVTELRPGEEARLLFRFPEKSGRYVFGSADSVQEDRGFLFRWDVNP